MKLKNIFLSAGTLATIITPIITIVSCDNKNEVKKIKTQNNIANEKNEENIFDLISLENRDIKAKEITLALKEIKNNNKPFTVIYLLEGKSVKIKFKAEDWERVSHIANDEEYLKEYSFEHLKALEALVDYIEPYLESIKENNKG